ncbi:hypothetical protein CSW38_02920 [Thermus scotoductus]|uniref:Uncharacterized protein n=1 Tax=Thermus scotoductus TaxID=37636 RepID=A0A430R896_THESC|nr:hypothetical protein CSW51_06130 [Thermus scotoductus]RTH03662.1 hypothetical protein CSW47_08175 [Thermus scotoductus]RTH27667.1 hypothetical protein CSW38_02920 [Thermus scotoductus]RTH97896.1 hypothetical protein CSW29_10935 [Thermus scotoductus]
MFKEPGRVFRPRPLPLLTWLSQLPPGRLLLLVYGLLLFGGALPYLVAPESLGSWKPHPRGFQESVAWTVFLHNALIALLISHFLPWLEGFLPPVWRGKWAGKLFLLCSALVTGVMASPHGLPQGAWYLALALPLALGEYLAFTLAAFGRIGIALLLLALLALYEGWISGMV